VVVETIGCRARRRSPRGYKDKRTSSPWEILEA